VDSAGSTVTKPAGTTAGDLLVALHFATADGPEASMTAPAGFVQQGSTNTITDGSFGMHGKVWTLTAGGSEPSNYTFAASTTSDGNAVILLAVQAGTYKAGAPFDVGPTTGGVASAALTTQDAPSVTTTVADTLLLCGFASTTFNNACTYTPPGGMTELIDYQPVANYIAVEAASETRSSAGATGTRTATVTRASYNATVSLAIAPAAAAVTPSYVADRGTAANATGGVNTTVTLTSPTTIAVGNYLIARIAVDNSGSSGAAPGCTVTDPRSNTWTVLGPALSDPGAASAGATAYLCYAKVVTAYQAADALTFTWGGTLATAKAIVVEEWRNIHSATPVAVSAVTNNSVTAGSTTAVSVSITPTAPGQLVYTCLATEGIAADTVGADSDTTNGNWATLTTTASADATATNNQRVSGQYKLVTTAGAQSWDSTITSRDWAAIAVVFAPLPFRAPDPRIRRLLPLLVR